MDTRTVFEHLGFKEDWQAITEQPPGYFYDFGNLLLCAIECTSCRSSKPVFLIGGVKCGPRSVGQIEFEMPLTIDSFEQGVALITQLLAKNSTRWFLHLGYRMAENGKIICRGYAVGRDTIRIDHETLSPV